MESRVRFVVVGAFSTLVIVAAFLFVLWIHTAGGLSQRRVVEIEFANAATGLRPGSAVLFNGVRIGEVVSVSFDPKRPQIVDTQASVDGSAPLRVDARVAIESQGLLGATAIALYGVSADAPLLGDHTPAVLRSATGGVSMTEEAQRTLAKINALVSDNSATIKDLINNIDVFSATLARNSGRVDDVLAGLAQFMGRGPKPVLPKLYDLTAPKDFPADEPARLGQVVVADLNSPLALDTQHVMSRDSSTGPYVIGETQWSDTLPKLLQRRLIATFEHAHYEKSVSGPFDQAAPDFQLLVDIRRFEIVGANMQAVVELSARLVGKDGRIVGARVFENRAPASARDGPEAAAALDKAFGATAVALVDWFASLKP